MSLSCTLFQDEIWQRAEFDRLSALPQCQLTKLGQMLPALDNGEEVVAGELSDLAGETDAAIGEQDLGLADAAGMDQELAGCGVARRVLVAEPEIEIAQRYPARFATPPYMDQTLPIRQHAGEFRASPRSRDALEARRKGVRASADANILHSRGS